MTRNDADDDDDIEPGICVIFMQQCTQQDVYIVYEMLFFPLKQQIMVLWVLHLLKLIVLFTFDDVIAILFIMHVNLITK